MPKKSALFAAVALAVLAPLSACSETKTTGEAASSTAHHTLAAAITGAPELSTVSDALSEAGLADVFDGPGSYTLLAPDDEAFDALGDAGESLTDEGNRAALVAVLRGHILPGQITPDAIRQAIAAKKGPVTMTTLADSTVTFDAQGDTITVSSSDGSRATVDGSALVATNGVVLPIDGFVHKVQPGDTPTP